MTDNPQSDRLDPQGGTCGLPGMVLRYGVVLWLALITLYFHHQEGLFNLSFLFGHDPMRPGLTLAIFQNAFTQPWRVAGAVPWVGMVSGALSGVAAMALGMTWIWGLGLRNLNRWIWAALGYGLGVGLVGIGTTFLAMAGWMTRWPVAVLWLILVVVAVALVIRQRRTPKSGDSPSELVEPEKNPVREPVLARIFQITGWILIGLMTVLTWMHAVGQRETYWDSLILYLGYTRMMVEEGGVVRRVVGQVGIGLGANYPHLFEFFAAQTGALFGRWDDQFGQWIAPMAGLAATILIYGTVLLASGGNRCAGVAAALAFRAYPSSLIYTQYASPYALGILAVAALLYLAAHHAHRRDRASLWGLLLVSAIACHINFLMIVLMPVALIGIILTPPLGREWPDLNPRQWLRNLAWPLAVAGALASPWFLRNWIVTGNPVYAFFPGILGGIHINPEVMDSAVVEWRANGDGLHVLGPSLAEKIRGLPTYFVTGSQAWKTAPVLVAWGFPGFLLAALGSVIGFVALLRRSHNGQKWPLSVLTMASILFLGLWTYAFVVADYYLYQIIPVSAAIGVLAGYLWCWLGQAGRGIRAVLSVIILLTGLAPGISMGLMGFKLKTGSAMLPSPQVQVSALRNLFLPADRIYRFEYGNDWDAFVGLNKLPQNARVLTHENRHLLHRVDLRLIHLDDWETQQAYGKPAVERQRILDGLGINWYLYVPNEDRHRVNSRLGMDELIRLGYWREIQKWPASRPSFPGAPPTQVGSPIAADHNVLFERTDQVP